MTTLKIGLSGLSILIPSCFVKLRIPYHRRKLDRLSLLTQAVMPIKRECGNGVISFSERQRSQTRVKVPKYALSEKKCPKPQTVGR